MAKVEIKQPIVDEIKGYAADAKAAVLVDYRGLTVEQDTKLRKALREAGVVYKVYKNTMLVRAFEGTDFAQLDKDLEGPTAVSYTHLKSRRTIYTYCLRQSSKFILTYLDGTVNIFFMHILLCLLSHQVPLCW